MQHKIAFEAVDRTLCDLKGNSLVMRSVNTFNGKRLSPYPTCRTQANKSR